MSRSRRCESTSTASKEKGVIVGYSAEVDPKKLSSQSIAMVGMDVDSGQYVGATRKLKDLDEVQALYTSSGDHMLMAERSAPATVTNSATSSQSSSAWTASPRRTLLPPGTVEVTTTVRRAIS